MGLGLVSNRGGGGGREERLADMLEIRVVSQLLGRVGSAVSRAEREREGETIATN